MARPSFTTTIPGVYTQSIADGPISSVTVPSSRYAQEIVVGTNRRKPEGWIPPTSYSLRRRVYRRHEGHIDFTRFNPNGSVNQHDRYVGVVGGGARGCNSLNAFNDTYMTRGVPSSWIDQCITEARLKMKRSDVNLAVAFAERNKTARMVTKTSLQCVRALRLLRRGNFWGAGRELGIRPGRPRGISVTERWLELQYGWKPLLQDVYGSVDALARRRGEDWIVTAKAAKSERIHSYFKGSSSGLDPNHGYGHALGTRGCFVRIDAIPTNDLLQVMSSFGITNPALLAWELTPYSFVVDWLLPVGDYLESLDAMLGYGPAWTSVSTLEKVDWFHELGRSEIPGTYPIVIDRKGVATQQVVNVTRQAYNNVPLAQAPRIKNPASLGHMANALSLLAQVFSGRS